MLKWAGLDSNQRKLTLADLQSAPFSHSGTDPDMKLLSSQSQAIDGTRTHDRPLTRRVLYQLSYNGIAMCSIPLAQSAIQDGNPLFLNPSVGHRRQILYNDRSKVNGRNPHNEDKMHTHQIGDIAEAKALSRFVELGYTVLMPFNQGLRYDFVIEREGNFQRVQVKTARDMGNGCIKFNSSSLDMTTNRARMSRDYVGEIDLFAVYSPHTDKVYALHVDTVPQAACYLRIEPPKNGQMNGIRWAADFEL